MAKKLKRTIYIGVGGTGTESVLEVRNYFKSLSPDGNLPPMVKFIFIDTSSKELFQLDPTLSVDEIFEISQKQAKNLYAAHPERYATIPNKSKIRAVKDGAGQVRSLGRFAIQCHEVSPNLGSFSERFAEIYHSIQNIQNEEGENQFEILGNETEIHLACSLSGGTGSGALLTIAYIIRNIAPNSTLVSYAFSPNFFSHLAAKERIKQNAYAALLELDYCMNADSEDYQDVKYLQNQTIISPPFDVFMYIDNKTFTRNDTIRSYTYLSTAKHDVVKSVAYAMAMSAGDLGTAADSVLDNIKSDIAGGRYAVKFSGNGEIKNGWVSSLGVSQIMCRPSSEETVFTYRAAQKLLIDLIGNPCKESDSLALDWINSININESGKDNDNDAVVDYIIKPSEYNDKEVEEIDRDSYKDGKIKYFQRVHLPILEKIDGRKTEFISRKKEEILKVVQRSVFNNDSAGLSGTIDILDSFTAILKEYATKMSDEKKAAQRELKSLDDEWDIAVESLRNCIDRTIDIKREDHISECEDDLKYIAQRSLVQTCESERKEAASAIFTQLALYTKNLSDVLGNFKRHAEAGKKTEIGKIAEIAGMSTHSDDRIGTFDLTTLAKDLSTAKPDNTLFELEDFFKYTAFDSIISLAECSDLTPIVENFVKTKFKIAKAAPGGNKLSEYPIIRILNNLEPSERKRYFEDAAKYALPLLCVEAFGEDVNTTEHIYVAVPGGNECDENIKNEITSALKGFKPRWVDINDPNRIIFYSQLGVIPPYFIEGISKGRNNSIKTGSCQESFESSLNGQISMFTDTQFEEKYAKYGFRLDRGKRNDAVGTLDIWVKAIVYGLILKDELGTYKVESDYGVVDIEDPLFRKWMTLGTNRYEAYESLKANDPLCNELEKRITEESSNKAQQMKLSSVSGKTNIRNYNASVALLDRTQDVEWSLPEVKALFTQEVNYLMSL